MVKADPDLAWLKEAEKRGDVDWKLIKETHDAYKYSNSSLGQGAMLAIIIIVTVLTAGAASALAASAGSAVGAGAGSTMAAATAATASAGAATAGLGNVIATAALTSMASTGAVSVINNKGNLGATFKDVTSSGAVKGYLTSAAMGGMMPGYDPASLGLDLGSLQAVLLKSASDAFVNTAINGGSYANNLSSALAGQAANVGMAFGFRMIGDYALGKYEEGSVQKVMAHALVGGLLAEATGGDFKTGAMAAGASEALVNVIKNMVGDDKALQVMASQLTGIAAAAAVNGDVEKGAQIAQYAATYNRQLHAEEQKWLEDNAQQFADQTGVSKQAAMERLSQQALKDTDILWRSILSDGNDSAAQAFLSGSGKTFVNELGDAQSLFTTTGNQLFRSEMFADSADPSFYKQFVQSGISRDLSTGLIKELKDSGVGFKNGVVDLYAAAQESPGAVLVGIWRGVKGLPAGMMDSFQESGLAIGEGAAVALNADIAAKLNAIYGQDVRSAQQAMLAIRIFTAVSGAKAVGKAGDVFATKIADVISKELDTVAKNLNPSSAMTDAEAGTLVDRNVLGGNPSGAKDIVNATEGIPGRVQSRINVANGRTETTPLRDNGNPVSAGFDHVLDGHFDREISNSRSVFTIAPDELKGILQSSDVVKSPVMALPDGQFVRTVDVGRVIGTTTLKDGGIPTSVIKVFTDKAGNLITTFPVKAGN
ncbi:DUF637 domain-containing protein [Pseudomonas huanghezhanensis]|uniref:DUF637 domain-containing protein n=1 Tax=Pseudomonas huanghezhanensis TaxID=3002903 RepID=UPI0038B474CA